MEGNEIVKNLYRLFEEIAKREKMESIESCDFGSAFVLAILEGIFKEAALTMPS